MGKKVNEKQRVKNEKLKLRIKKVFRTFLRILFRFKFLSIDFLFSCLPAGVDLRFA